MRVLVRVLSLLLGLALAAAGALLAVEVAWAWWRPESPSLLVPWRQWRETLADLSWQSTPVLITAVAVAVVGLLLALFASLARRTNVGLREPSPGVTVETSPRSLARIVGTRVRGEDNVTGASVSATAKRVRVRATSALESEAQLRPRLSDAVRSTLADLPLQRQPQVSVVVDSRRDRS
ncbi:DUF6286 domain-containing protein [Actinokineospora xionganensis]|uniref:DUF6286 domain-containing protein n=1 Tax=Actinokineospora xionganensis TaxID=2684470 RepID=A0ABR7LAI1_9PSEU|nr:DUF6286 domain-containing protein [Actinokineospora xionganensis]MBC6449498.1 hypothetical protein [Actinokineospora xionganensis]